MHLRIILHGRDPCPFINSGDRKFQLFRLVQNRKILVRYHQIDLGRHSGCIVHGLEIFRNAGFLILQFLPAVMIFQKVHQPVVDIDRPGSRNHTADIMVNIFCRNLRIDPDLLLVSVHCIFPHRSIYI